MKRNTIIGIIIGVIVIALVIVLAVTAKKNSRMENPNQAPSEQTTTGNGAKTPAPAQNGAKGPGDVLGTTPNQQISEKSDLVSFSVSAGSRILGSTPATGTVDASYVSGNTISIQLANADGKTLKTIRGTVTGTNTAGNKTFSATISTDGVTKGAGYIVFKQASGSRTVMVPVIFE